MIPSVKASIVIPIHNEQAILESAVVELLGRWDPMGTGYELMLTENGSVDDTRAIAKSLADRFAQVRCLSVGTAGHGNYGLALREGILGARGEFVICDEIDLCDVDFHVRALGMLDRREADLVIGSKRMRGAEDQRPIVRRLGSLVITAMLRLALGFSGTDTHGLKAFRRSVLLPVLHTCVADKDLFASELVVRAQRAGVSVKEIPIRVAEKRPTSVSLLRRVPGVLRGLARLVVAIRIGR